MKERSSAHWLDSRWAIPSLTLLAAVPLFGPEIPPLADLPGHMGRYAVQLGQAGEAAQHWYDFNWQLIGNLGVDLLVEPFGRLFGVELGTKLVVMAIPMLMALAILLVSKELHGRVSPVALFALPLAYCYPFLHGFVNFMLSAALAFLAFALWLRLARQKKFRLRAILFIPISILLWLVHTYGFGLFGVLAFSAEIARERLSKSSWQSAFLSSCINCMTLVLPLLLTFATRSEASGISTERWFEWSWKARFFVSILRDRWMLWDVASLTIPILLLSFLRRRTDIEWSQTMLIASALFGLLFVISPWALFGLLLADMRLAPFILMTALLAPAPADWVSGRSLRWIGLAGLALFGARIAGTTISLADDASRMDQALVGLQHIPKQAKLFSLVGQPCEDAWKRSKLDHLPALALTRRHAFSNDQWGNAGAQLIRVPFLQGSEWDEDGSHLAFPDGCREGLHQIGQQIAGFPRATYDYIWIIDLPSGTNLNAAGLKLLWSNGPDRVYQIVREENRSPPSSKP